MMMKRIGLMVRIVFAVIGIGLIVVIVVANWHGRVVLPAGYGGTDLPELSVRITAVQDDGKLTVYQLADNKAGVASINELQLTDAADTPTLVPGTIETLRSASVPQLLVGWALMGLVFPLQGLRWWGLLRCRGLMVGYGKAFRLTMVGQFFNTCMPGSTGGDVVRAYYAAKGSGRGTEAVVTVVFDRAAGLLGLVLLAGVLGLFQLGHPLVRPITVTLWVGLGVLLVSAAVYASPGLRRVLRLHVWAAGLPGAALLRRFDAAVVAYRHHVPAVVAAVALSLPVHLLLSLSLAMSGYALGIEQPLLEMLVLIPVVFTAGSIPVSPSGLGVMEGAAVVLITGAVNQVISMMLLYRLMQVSYGLAGAGIMLVSDIRLHPAEAADNTPTPAAGHNVGA